MRDGYNIIFSFRTRVLHFPPLRKKPKTARFEGVCYIIVESKPVIEYRKHFAWYLAIKMAPREVTRVKYSVAGLDTKRGVIFIWKGFEAMKSLRKIGKLKLIGLIAIIPVLAVGTVFAYNIATPSKTVNESTQTKQEVKTDKTSKQTDNSESEDTTPTDQTASESTTDTPTQSTSQAPTATTTNPTQTATSTAPQQTTTNPTPTTPTCNESMKSSYTSLYNSQVNAENASWNNQINAWRDEATGRGVGGAFSGWVQEQINQNKPAHDARLAQLQTQYYQNLASINCTP